MTQSLHQFDILSAKPGSGKSSLFQKDIKLSSDTYLPILAVPSKELQHEYNDKLLSGSCPLQLEMINHDELDAGETVVKRFIKRLAAKTPLSITHEALKLIDHASINQSFYANRDLYIDEAFNPIWSVEITLKANTSGEAEIINTDMIKWLNPTSTPINGFIQLRPTKSKHYYSLLDMNAVRTIENKNFKVYISESNWKDLMSYNAYKINLFGVYDFNILGRFRKVSIASAAFHTTALGILLKKFGAKLKIVNEFEKQDEKIVFHVAKLDGSLYSHSKNAVLNETDRTNEFRKYVDSVVDGRECLLLRNVTDDSVVSSNYKEITNNCHGINKHRTVSFISIESSYNPSNNLLAFYMNVLGFTKEEVTLAMSANTFYQSIMRTAARNKSNTDEIHVFLLDAKVLHYLIEHYFDNFEVKYIDLGKSERKQKRDVEIDSLKSFIERHPDGKFKASEVYSAYKTHSGSEIAMRSFGEMMKSIGIDKTKTKSGYVYSIPKQVASV